ncbi:MAG: AAA family ATPase, partial [Treponema sp.]|nr:AAA family ATPase [Treponema sp.]
AITRARDKLYITSCKKRKHRQDIIECSPSPFLDEIPQNLTVYHKEEKELSPDQAGDFFAKMRELYGDGAKEDTR